MEELEGCWFIDFEYKYKQYKLPHGHPLKSESRHVRTDPSSFCAIAIIFLKHDQSLCM